MKTVVSALLLFGLLSGCAYSRQQAEMDPSAPLYERLGGKEAIAAVVQDLTRNIGQDDRINGFFIGVDLEHVQKRLTAQICEASGGPCHYSGPDMHSVHAGMNITEAQFNALVEDLVKSLNQHGVPQREQRELLHLLAAMKKDIVKQ